MGCFSFFHRIYDRIHNYLYPYEQLTNFGGLLNMPVPSLDSISDSDIELQAMLSGDGGL